MADDPKNTPQEKTFTQADVDKLIEENNAKHQDEMNALAGKLRAEFKEKEQKAKEAAELAKLNGIIDRNKDISGQIIEMLPLKNVLKLFKISTRIFPLIVI